MRIGVVVGTAIAVIAASVFGSESAQAFTAAPVTAWQGNAAYYGDSGAGVASRMRSPYIVDVARILERERAPVERACSAPHAAMILDVDDTTLATYDMYVGSMHYRLDNALKAVWVRNERFPAVPGMVAFATAARQSGCRLIVISGRPISQTAATLANLAKVGYPPISRAYLAKPGTGLTTQQFKTATRARLERAGLIIVANIGDQKSDLVGGHAARGIRLPNRMYTVP